MNIYGTWLKAYLKLSKLIKKVKPDIVHYHSSKAGVLGRIAAKRRRVNKIFYTPTRTHSCQLNFQREKNIYLLELRNFCLGMLLQKLLMYQIARSIQL
ncbi:glycosyltransferase [Streptococcus thermophilus]|uniref:glycosyltransferase n=1 Tax=Streptococcus thermophilus TaxID=1308 RepID=UPI001E3C42DA|nr:glycosyltransferase [Streptococcus thermophilus]